MKNSFKIITLLLLISVLNCTSEDSTENTSDEVNKTISNSNQMKSGDISDFDLTNEYVLNTDYGVLVYYKSLSENEKYLFKDQNGSFSQIIIQPKGKFNYFNFDSELELNFESKFNEELGFEIVDLSNYSVYRGNSGCNCETSLALDLSMCIISAAAIAASDGPLPFMDAAAISYGVACGTRAGLAHEDCVAACLNN